jgi:tape measure domain-containing protein
MASPTAVNIGIGFDIKEVMQNTGIARNEIARFTRDVKNSLTDAEKFARDANVANVLFQKGQIDDSTHQKMIAMYRERYKVIDEVAAREAQQQAHQRARLDEYAAHKQAMAKREEDQMIFLHNIWKNFTAEREAKERATAEESAKRKKAELDQILAQQQQEIQGILRIEQSRQQASKLLLDSINNERQATQRAAEAEKNARWDTINFLIKSEADLAEQKRKRNQEELAAQEKLKQNAIDLMKSQASLGIVSSGRPSQIPATDLSKPLIDPVTGQQIAAKKEILSLDEAIAKLERDTQQEIARHATENAIREKQNAEQTAADINNKRRLEKARIDELKKNSQELEASVASQKREKEYNRIRGMVDQAKTAQQRYAEAVKFVKDQEKLGAITKQELIAIQRNLNAELKSQTFVGQFIAGLGITTGPMLAAQAILQVVGAIKSFVRESVVLAAEYQRTEAAMKALTGSTAEATKKMIEFRELDKKTPLSFLDFARGAKTLMGFGLEAERTGAIMKSLSAISMGNAERFQSLALAFGQVRASGKLAGQEVLQMVNAGFNPLQEIAKLTGESMADLRQKTTDGQISFEEVALAIELATEAGGRFATMNEELQLTLAGQYDKYLSDMKMVQVQLGENLMPLMVQLLGLSRDLLLSNDELGESYNFLRTASGSLAVFVAYVRDTFSEGDLFNMEWTNVNAVLDQIEEARREREFQEGMAKRKREEDEAKEQERAKKRLELGEEGYRQWRLNEARKETQTRNAEKQAEEKAKNELDAIEKTRQEFERLGKTKRELYMESIGFNAPGISVAEQAKRQQSLKEFDAIEAHKKEEEAIKKKVRALVEEKNEVELLELAKRRKITQDELADAKEAIAEKRKEEARKKEEKKQQDQIQRLVKENDLLGLRNLLAQKKIDQGKFDEAKQKIEDNVKSIQERFNPAIKYKNDLQEIKNLLAAGLIDQQTAEKAGAALAKSIMGNIQQYQAPTRVGSMGDAMLAAQRASMTDKHQKMVEKYLKEIADKIAKNPGLIANFNP